MRRLLITGSVLALCLLSVRAQEKPALPKTPAGFNEGRETLLRDAAGKPFAPGMLVERLFESADLAEIAGFCIVHLTTAERAALDTQLELKGTLGRAADVAAMQAAFEAGKLKPAAVAGALGITLAKREFKLEEVIAWLYARGVNFNALQGAMDGGRNDAMRLRANLRTLEAGRKSLDVLFEAGHWEFSLADGREIKGGHYDGPQLVESLLAMGWTEEKFQSALPTPLRNGLSAEQRALVKWGDAKLLWNSISRHVAEVELFKGAMFLLKSTTNRSPVFWQTAVLRTQTCDRWFRTGGKGVIGVWAGPLPNARGEPKPPMDTANKLAKAGAEEFAEGLTDALKAHFAQAKADTLTIVGYADGSARMIIDRPGRAAVDYKPDTPPGAPSTKQLYEGRYSPDGRVAFASLVYADSKTVAPRDIDLVNVRTLAEGALLAADLDDGVALTPLLLRRVSRLVDAP